MTEEKLSKPPDSRGYKPIYEKMIPAAVITLVVIGFLMLILAAAIALGFIGAG
jgi:hypothetical protein